MNRYFCYCEMVKLEKDPSSCTGKKFINRIAYKYIIKTKNKIVAKDIFIRSCKKYSSDYEDPNHILIFKIDDSQFKRIIKKLWNKYKYI